MARLIHLSDLHFGAHDQRLVDAVEFQLPLWPFSACILPLVRRDLRRLFAFRHQATRVALTSTP